MVALKSRGEETRSKLIRAGTRLFGLSGFHGVSMRELAREADVNLATASYHFGGKAGLYEAILHEICDCRGEVTPSTEEVLAKLEQAGDDKAKRSRVASWYVDYMVRGMVQDPDNIAAMFIISREMNHPSEFYPILQEHFFDPAFQTLNTLLEGVMGQDVSMGERIITGLAVIGMCTKFLEGKSIILKRMGWKDYDQDAIDMIAEILGRRVLGFLGLDNGGAS